jgi:hypothetical protein
VPLSNREEATDVNRTTESAFASLGRTAENGKEIRSNMRRITSAREKVENRKRERRSADILFGLSL